MDIKEIDVTFDFTTDTPGYWDNFWENNRGLGAGGNDPDAMSPMLQEYHRLLWSRTLPNGEDVVLTAGAGSFYLSWNGFRFGSDSITASFRYEKYRYMIELLKCEISDYKAFTEHFLRKAYTIGGMIIFPKRVGGMNQARGCHPLIKDRWDLTLECIRKYYAGEKSPLWETMQKDKAFFDLFVNFEGYVDFFFLQDCVTDDYSAVNFWIGNGDFKENPLPKSTAEYIKWIGSQLTFVEKRNIRIKKYCEEKSLCN